MSFSVNHFIGPVTSLKYVEDHLLIGCGPNLHVTGKSVESLCVLPARRIYGIRVRERDDRTTLCVYGQKALRIIDFSKSGDERKLCPLSELQEVMDWIQDICWLDHYKDEDSVLAIALSHNRVIVLDWMTGTTRENIQCQEICILYSAHWIWTSWNDLVLAAGTVFNQVVLWSPVGGRDKDGRAEIQYRLTGHQGVIFSISYNYDRGILCTVSDDRSIRLWKVLLPGGDTGNDIPCLQVLYGHTARVWDVRLLSQWILSIGEDAICCIWDYEGNIIKKLKGHTGRNIWSIAVNSQETEMVTGGGDCSVRKWSLDGSLNSSESHTYRVPLELNQEKSDFPRCVGLWSSGLLVLTNEGVLYGLDPKCTSQKVILDDTRYRSYGVLAVSPNRNTVLLANISGGCFIINSDGRKLYVNVFDGKINSICWCNDELYLLSGPDGKMILMSLNQNDDKILTSQLSTFCLPYARHRWATTAIFVSETLIVGDRGGSIHTYDCKSNSLEQCQSFPKIHGKAGVTCMCNHGNMIMSCGRDGHVREFELLDGHLESLGASRVAQGLDWLCRLSVTGEDISVMGFHSTSFLVYDYSTNQKLLQIPCGGGHRSWDFRLSTNKVTYLYIKAGDVWITEDVINMHQTELWSPLHGRELTCVRHVTTLRNKNGTAGDLFITSSEETSVNLVKVGQTPGDYSVVTRLQGHLSSVRAIALCRSNGEPQTWLMVSCGGRAQMFTWLLHCDDKGHVTTKHLANHILSEKGLKRRKPWKQKMEETDLETRYMAVDVFSLSDTTPSCGDMKYIVGTACSDGWIRIFTLDTEEKKFQLVTKSDYHNHCVLCIDHITIQTVGGQKVLLVSAATDGKVAFWDMSLADNSLGQPLLSLSLHQSGINSLDIKASETDNEILLVTGGDDNALTLTSVIVSDLEGFTLSEGWRSQISSAHATQITGVSLINSGGDIVSVSIDQRLSLWKVDKYHKMIQVNSKFIDVADVSCLDVWSDSDGIRKLVISGVGLQIVSLMDS